MKVPMKTIEKCSTFVKCTRTRTLEDRISGLPYDVLSIILSHLTMKEAVQTSIVSPSWKHLWKAYSGFLDFEAPPNLVSLIEYDPEREYDSQLVFEAKCRYTSWVDKLLDSFQSPTIQGLRIAFELNNTFSHHIDRWIEFAIFNKVESLVLDLAPPCRKPGNDEYVFPARLLYSPIGGFHAFDRLTCLELRFVAVPEEVTQYIFGNCHSLQRFCLDEVLNIKNLRLDNSLPELKHLEITRCRFLENLYVSARRLTSFQYVSFSYIKTNVVFGDVPQLSELVLGGRHYKVVLDNLPINLSQLDSVSLLDSVSFFYFPIDECLWSRPWPYMMIPDATLGRFQELKQLELNLERCLGDRIECAGTFLQASTCLEKLVIKLTWINPAQAIGEGRDALSRHRHIEHVVMGFEHKCLKEVVYVGWLGLDAEVEIVQLVIESARSSLERITINLDHSCNNKDAVNVKLETRWEKDNAKARAMQLQQKLVSSNAKLLVN